MPAGQQIGARIRRARKQLRLTQQELADKVGVSRNTVDSWENNRSYPKRYDVALEEVLGISLTGEGGAAPAGELADLLPAQDDWEASVLADRYLDDATKRLLIERSRDARAAYDAGRRERQDRAEAG